jgi:large subunit ribosomal protein L46
VVLSRSPQITRDLHPFEKSFYLYQKRLNERLSLPFSRYLWYKKGSAGLADLQRRIKDRHTPAHDIGAYNAYSKEAWNDEPLVGAQEGELERQLQNLLEDEMSAMPEKITETKEEAEASRPKPQPRLTEADHEGNTKSLDRLLQRTLYLMVESAEGKWQFPTAPVNMAEKETLHAVRKYCLLKDNADIFHPGR